MAIHLPGQAILGYIFLTQPHVVDLQSPTSRRFATKPSGARTTMVQRLTTNMNQHLLDTKWQLETHGIPLGYEPEISSQTAETRGSNNRCPKTSPQATNFDETRRATSAPKSAEGLGVSVFAVPAKWRAAFLSEFPLKPSKKWYSKREAYPDQRCCQGFGMGLKWLCGSC